MKKHRLALSAVLVLSVAFGGCKSDIGTAGGAYQTKNFSFSVSEDMVLDAKNQEGDATYLTFSNAADETQVLKIQEYSYAHSTAKAEMEYLSTENAEITSLSGALSDAYRLSVCNEAEGLMWLVTAIGSEGKLLMIEAKLPESGEEWYISATEHIADTVSYTGDPIEAGEARQSHYIVKHSKQWAHAVDEEDADAEITTLFYANAQSTREQSNHVKIQLSADQTLTPKEAAEQIANHYREFYWEQSMTETTVFGYDAWCSFMIFSDGESEEDRDRTYVSYYFFTVDDVLYEVQISCYHEQMELLEKALEEVTLMINRNK
ncbi:MAG: hypothetical protein IKM30_02000 [Oscillospiraceae bacterium]|nr:hypothetical protein [Oscillospiraceae bacterium]